MNAMCNFIAYVIVAALVRCVSGDKDFVSSHFRLASCTCSEISSFVPANESDAMSITPSLLSCAVSIQNALLAHGIFRPNITECQPSLELKTGMSQQRNTEKSNCRDTTRGDCTILTIQRYNESDSTEELQNVFAQWQTLHPDTLMGISHADFLPYKIITSGSKRLRLIPATYALINSTSFFSASYDHVSQNVKTMTFKTPIYKMFLMYMQDDIKTGTSASLFLDGNKRFFFLNTKQQFKVATRNDFEGDGKNAGFTVVRSIGSLTTALLKGYRRVQRGPYNARAVIDMKENDVLFDATEMIPPYHLTEKEKPIYVTSVKESAKSGKAYHFRHKAHAGSNSLPCLETDADTYWVMETTWTKLHSRQPTETVLDVLKEKLLEGKEVRLVIGGEISTDVVSALVTPSDVILTLTKYLIPFKGIDAKDTAIQNVRFPVFGCHSQRLLECEMEFMTSNMVDVVDTTYTSNIDWFVSSRNWTKVLEILPDYQIVSGSFLQLYEAASQGNNVRVCVLEDSGNTLCHGTHKLQVNLNQAVLQSMSMIQIVGDQSQNLKGLQDNCKRSYRLIDAGGSIKTINYVAGVRETPPETSIKYQKQDWFVEYP